MTFRRLKPCDRPYKSSFFRGIPRAQSKCSVATPIPRLSHRLQCTFTKTSWHKPRLFRPLSFVHSPCNKRKLSLCLFSFFFPLSLTFIQASKVQQPFSCIRLTAHRYNCCSGNYHTLSLALRSGTDWLLSCPRAQLAVVGCAGRKKKHPVLREKM
jgi:hypothetical protein